MAELALEHRYQEREPIALLTNKPLKKKRTYKQHDNGKILDFIRQTDASPDFAYRAEYLQGGYRQIWYRTKDGFRQLVKFRQLCAEEDVKVGSVEFRIDHDYYITKNSFSAPWRRSEYLFSFDNIVIDVDRHDKSLKWYAEKLNYEIDKLLFFLENGDYEGEFPEFNVVRTGRGVQLWIGLVSFSARVEAFRRRYRRICEHLCDVIKKIIAENNIDLEVDYKASTDPTQLVRIPFTNNQARYNKNSKYGKNGYTAQLEVRTDYRYNLDEIQEFLDIPIITQHKKAPKKAASPQSKDYIPLNKRRTATIEYIVEQTNGNCEGRREIMLHLYYNALVQITDLATAETRLRKLNSSFKESLPDAQIRAIIAEFERKRANIGKTTAGNDGNKYPETGFYSYPKELWLESLQATTTERLFYESQDGRTIARKEAREAKAKRDERITELSKQGKTQAEIAKEVGCSVDTVQRKTRDKKADRDRRIIELRKDGLSVRDIAATVGCSKNTVTAVLAKQTQTATESAQDTPQPTERKPYVNPHPERIWGQPETYMPKDYTEAQRKSFLQSFERARGKPRSSA